MKLKYFSALFLLYYYSLFAQQAPFKVRYQGKVKGDMTIIANNIVNRMDYNNSGNEPYYNHTDSAKLNDEFDMEYIDIDHDESTFSSSSAELIFNDSSNKKVLYAGLYWSATYKYNVGIQTLKDKFISEDPKREAINSIKLKLPNQQEYIDISGEIIFDGINEAEDKDIAPYVGYANITDYVKSIKGGADGVYTVANIRATQGKIRGGVAGGWTIFIVYEDDKMSEKNITSKDGFARVSNNEINIVFDGFETPINGNIKAKIACATLEGDNNIIGDQLFFSANGSKSFTALSNSIRNENNFFNSCISIENQYFMNRFPDSKNTLGYDTLLYTIPNENNALIGNGIQKSILKFKSSGDNYFIFFSAFNVETTSNITNSINNNNSTIIDNSVINKENGQKQQIKYVPINNDLLVDDLKTASVINRINKNTTLGNELLEIQMLNSSSQPSGYYILANIFKTEQKTQEFIYYLKSKGIKGEFFTNPLNNYNYVFIKKAANQQEAIDLYNSKLNNTYKERIQILSINNKNDLPLEDKKEENKKGTVSKILPENKNGIKEDKLIQPESKLTETKIYKKAIEKNTVSNSKSTINSGDLHVANIPNEPKGYYIVANVFAINESSNNFINALKAKGLKPKTLINTLNNYKYIYLKKVDTEEEAKTILTSKFNNKYKSKLWVLSVNNTKSATDIE